MNAIGSALPFDERFADENFDRKLQITACRIPNEINVHIHRGTAHILRDTAHDHPALDRHTILESRGTDRGKDDVMRNLRPSGILVLTALHQLFNFRCDIHQNTSFLIVRKIRSRRGNFSR